MEAAVGDPHRVSIVCLRRHRMVIMVIMTRSKASDGAGAGRSVSEVKARFSEFVREAERGEPVVITRHGQAVAALVSAEGLKQLERLRSVGPEGGLASLAGGWAGSEELVRVVEASPRQGTRDAEPID
jgi:prevent-host-death family protein